MCSLRTILGIQWQDNITHLEVLNRAETTGTEAMIFKAQLRWTGRVYRMDNSRIPQLLLYGELCSDKRNRRRHEKRYKDNVKANIILAGIPARQLEVRAQDRADWCALTKQTTDRF